MTGKDERLVRYGLLATGILLWARSRKPARPEAPPPISGDLDRPLPGVGSPPSAWTPPWGEAPGGFPAPVRPRP